MALLAAEGDALPSVAVDEGKPGEEVNVAELFKGKKGVLFAVPGAFTPWPRAVWYFWVKVDVGDRMT